MNRIVLAFALLLPALTSAQALEQRLKALTPGQWLGYDVALQPGLRAPCCFEWKDSRDAMPRTCKLSERDWSFGHSEHDPAAPAGSTLRVLVRRDGESFDRLRAMGSNCGLDKGAETVVEAGNVDAAQSLAFLAPAMESGEHERTHAIMAIAHHAGTEADTLLERTATSGPERLRRDAAFWLANARGEFGYRVVRRLIDEGARGGDLNHLVFALSISDVPAAKDELRRLAQSHADHRVRGEAMFWLAQNDDAQAETILRQGATSDSSAHVRKKAVFALSQLPAERAVPVLLELVKQGDSREVRKEALFWLAQIDDDAVLPVFDELLK